MKPGVQAPFETAQHTALGAETDLSRRREVASLSLCRVVHDINAQGWCQGTGGNFSITLSREPQQLLITQSGQNKRHIGPEGLVIVGADGQPVAGEKGKPSAESLLHSIVVELTGAGSVLHTHSVPATLLGEHFCAKGGLTITGYEMLKGLEGIRTHETGVFVPVLENSQDMVISSEQVKGLLTNDSSLRGFLLAGHGLYTWGTSLEQAERHVEILEFLFECVERRTRLETFDG